MHYLPPYYYPYSPPYVNAIPDPISLRQKYAEIESLDYYTKLAESEAVLRANEDQIASQNYARSLLINSKVQSDLYEKMYGHTFDETKVKMAQANVQYNYLKKIEELRRQRQMLDHPGKLNLYPKTISYEEKLERNDERYLSDDQLVNYYQSGAKGQDYHYEMYKKLQNPADNNQSFKTDRTLNKNDGWKEQQSKETGYKTKEKLKNQQVQKSYVDQLNQSQGKALNNSELAFERSRKQIDRGATIDVVRPEREQSPLGNTFYNISKKKKSSTGMNKTTLLNSSRQPKTKKQKMANSFIGKPYNISFNVAITESALQKINNRLKVSAIVYKDSKLRHTRHEAEHLFNTFQNQVKMRKEVKDKINNNPSILRKHNMVVSSR